MSKCLRFVIVLFVFIAPMRLRSQTLGIDGGLMQDLEHGAIESTCGCAFDDAKGFGFTSAFTVEASLGVGFFAGVRMGYEQQNVSASTSFKETAIVQDTNGNTDTVSLPITRTMDISLSYLTAMPFVEYKVPKIGVFVQSGISTEYPLKSSIKIDRELDQTSTDLKFQNGTTTEPIDPSAPIPDLNSPQFAASFALGEEFEILEAKFYIPARYNVPLTEVQSTASWHISSLGAVLGMKFDIK